MLQTRKELAKGSVSFSENPKDSPQAPAAPPAEQAAATATATVTLGSAYTKVGPVANLVPHCIHTPCLSDLLFRQMQQQR